MNWFALILGGLATYRLSLLLTKEDGPAYVFRRIRRLPAAKTSAREGLQCLWCASVGFSALVTGYEWWLGWIPGLETPLYWLGMSSVAIFCNQTWTKG